MKTDVKIKYNEAFGTTHSRDYYKGKSFHYSGEWTSGAHYFSDDYNVDFIVKDNCLLACAQSHFATLDNEPKDFIYDTEGSKIGIASRYWDFVLAGIKGNIPIIKVEDEAWWVSYNDGTTWEKLTDIVDTHWGDQTDDSVVLSVNRVQKVLLTNVKAITDEEIDSILSRFNIPHKETDGD